LGQPLNIPFKRRRLTMDIIIHRLSFVVRRPFLQHLILRLRKSLQRPNIPFFLYVELRSKFNVSFNCIVGYYSLIAGVRLINSQYPKCYTWKSGFKHSRPRPVCLLGPFFYSNFVRPYLINILSVPDES
jgi:hypothetical protein